MSSRPSASRDVSNLHRDQKKPIDDRSRTTPDLSRPLPAPPSSLPNEYGIPTLRRKPLPETPTSTQAGHTRSVSHPFPSFFGGKRQEKKPVHKQDELDSSEDGAASSRRIDSRSNVPGRATNPNPNHKQPKTGKCMTCDSTVRWPSDLKVFRCTTCLTINDLEPCDLGISQKPNDVNQKPLPVSLERARRILESCIDDYLKETLGTGSSGKQKVEFNETFLLSDDEVVGTDSQITGDVFESEPLPLPGQSPQRRRPSDSRSPNLANTHRGSPNVEAKLSHPSPTQTRKDQGVRSQHGISDRPIFGSGIFRPFENYLAETMTGCTALNMSFFSVKPAPQKDDKPARPHIGKQQASEYVSNPVTENDVFLSDLDAKMLLLGDFAENGSWWTGRAETKEDAQLENARERSPERWRGIVTTRTPRINWLELAEWYRLILHAGDEWHRRWTGLKPSLNSEQLAQWQITPLDTVHRHIMESQIHLQRTFLKATENLLKRPRRPLKNPEDCRFLLILLANPLLSPTSRNTPSRTGGDDPGVASRNQPPANSPSKSARPPRRNHSGLGRHSGIIKRILGLLAHTSNDIHPYLVSWFARFPDSHFTGWVELIGGFVNYRLIRQSNKPTQEEIDPTAGLIPNFSEAGLRHASQVHAALGGRSNTLQKQNQDGKPRLGIYGEDWQLRAAARVMSLFFNANIGHAARRRDTSISPEQRSRSAGLNAKHQAFMHGQLIPINNFYNSMLDHADLVADFEAWETTKIKFTFCQYPFFLSLWAKIRILEFDARRQMESRAREAFFDSILSRKAVSQFFVLPVRRDCLVDDSLKGVSEAIGRGGSDIKKGLRIDFIGEEGVDAGGLRKEWFLLLVREIFNPNHGLFAYDEDSSSCYFNPFCFESSEQFFLVGTLLGLAIYNSTILDVAFPPFLFKKMLASAPSTTEKLTSTPKIAFQHTLEDLAELRPSLARGLRQLLDYDGDVQEVFCRDFVIEIERYGDIVQVPLCPGGSKRPVTNTNRREFVDLYVHYLLDQSVARQYEPFKRGFFTVCAGNALSLFRPEEIELLVRGSDEPLDVSSLRAVATYDGWPKDRPPQEQRSVTWFWDFFEQLSPDDQRKMLGFITGSDRIPAMGATNLVIRIQCLTDTAAEDVGVEPRRLPTARTCFNLIGIYDYHSRKTLEQKLWMAVTSSEGFGLK